MNKRNVKITKLAYDVKGYASFYDVQILNCFNPKLQHEHTKPTIKSKLRDLLTQLKGFKIVATPFLVLKKI